MRKYLVIAGVLSSLALVAPAASAADSGRLYSQSARAHVEYVDSNDWLQACDLISGDGRGARAILQVRQSDGTWSTKDYVEAWNGCNGARREIVREGALMNILACDLVPGGWTENCSNREFWG